MNSTAYAAGSTGVTLELRAFTASTGLPYTAGTFDTAGITAQYIRNRTAAVAITLVTQTAAGTWTSGGFVHLGAGIYRLDVPDAAFAAGSDDVLVVISGISDVLFTVVRVELLGANPRSGTIDANVTSVATNAINANALATDAVNEIADGILNRDMSVGTDSGSTTVRTVRQALRAIRNRFAISAGTATFYKEDDSTVSHTAVVTGSPVVTQVNPAGGA